ncbi:PA3496 family putative envelope integrity protein [Pseudomonas sp. Kh14]
MDVTTEFIDSKENIHFKKESSPSPCSVITRRRIEAILEEQALRKQWEL